MAAGFHGAWSLPYVLLTVLVWRKWAELRACRVGLRAPMAGTFLACAAAPFCSFILLSFLYGQVDPIDGALFAYGIGIVSASGEIWLVCTGGAVLAWAQALAAPRRRWFAVAQLTSYGAFVLYPLLMFYGIVDYKGP